MSDKDATSSAPGHPADHAAPDRTAQATPGPRQLPTQLCLSWVLAATIAGAVTRGAHPYTLILTGLAFGFGQWIMLRRQLHQTSWLAQALWIPASALGGLVGYLIIASWGVQTLGPPIIALAAPYENLASHIIFVTLLWIAIGLAQWPLLRPQHGRALWWVPASAAGGTLSALTDDTVALVGGAIHGSLLAGALAGAAYGAVTGSVLVRLAARG